MKGDHSRGVGAAPRRLKRPLPAGRTLDQVWNHYQVEKEIADRLRRADKDERRRLYATMYDELFRKVPDHPRLARRDSRRLTERTNRSKWSLVEPFLSGVSIFAEFAPGDCRFAIDVSRRVERGFGIDISDQRNSADEVPDNFRLILYDGYSLEGIEDGTVDLLFSDQLIEHLPQEETQAHFVLCRRLLSRGGRYVFRTPHAFGGPHDVSAFFSDVPQGFHLKEWTCRELTPLLLRAGFGTVSFYWTARGLLFRLPGNYWSSSERLLEGLLPRLRRRAARWAVPTICCVAQAPGGRREG